MNSNDYALVIEDSVSMRKFVSTILRHEAHIDQVVEAENPTRALELLRGRQGRLSVIVSDWNMPGMSLPSFMQALKNHPDHADASIFLLTASAEARAREVAEAIQANAVLTKPFSAEHLLDLLATHGAIKERRRAKRIIPLKKCVIDLGFDDTLPALDAEVLNLSESGVLVRSPIPCNGSGFIYDFAGLILHPEDSDTMKVYARVVRIEADPSAINRGGETVLMAFEFGRMDDTTLTKLRAYIGINNLSDDIGPPH